MHAFQTSAAFVVLVYVVASLAGCAGDVETEPTTQSAPSKGTQFTSLTDTQARKAVQTDGDLPAVRTPSPAAATATPLPAPTATPTVEPATLFDSAGALAVSMSLSEAEKRTLGLLAPSHAPRLEFSRLVTSRQLRGLRPNDPRVGEYAYENEPSEFPDVDLPVFVVVASTQDMRVRSLRSPCQNGGFDWCKPVGPEDREGIALFCDATTGEQLGGEAIGPEAHMRDFIAELRPIEPATPVVTLTMSPTPTPSYPTWTPYPLPTETPMPVYGRAGGDASMLGRWWRYRLLGRMYGVYWQSATVNVTVGTEERDGHHWQVPQIGVEWTHRPPESEWAGISSWMGLPVPRLLGEDGDVLSCLHPDLQAHHATLTPTPAPEIDGLSGWLATWSHLIWCREGESISTAAGTFENCLLHRETLNAGSVSYTWTFPGPGLVYKEVEVCYTVARRNIVLELVDWWGRPP